MGEFPACYCSDRRPDSLRARHARGQPVDRSLARQSGGGSPPWLTRSRASSSSTRCRQNREKPPERAAVRVESNWSKAQRTILAYVVSRASDIVRAVYWPADAPDLSPIPISRPIRGSLYACIAGMLYLGLFPNCMVRLAAEAVKTLP